jgi:hypothetical protein
VGDSVFVGYVDRGGGAGLGRQQGSDLPRIFIEQEELLVVRASGAKQVEAVGLRLGERLLVPIDNFGGVVFHAAQGDESAALERGSRRSGEGLRVGINRGG